MMQLMDFRGEDSSEAAKKMGEFVAATGSLPVRSEPIGREGVRLWFVSRREVALRSGLGSRMPWATASALA